MSLNWAREKTFDKKCIKNNIKLMRGPIPKHGITLFSIMRNELFFVRSFLEYHRRIGVNNFLILDDGSEDGTKEYLEKQDDVFLLQSSVRYKDQIKDGEGRYRRAGPVLKEFIPSMFLQDKFHIYLDADEFLFLPPQVRCLNCVIHAVQKEGRAGVAASLVEFFPESIYEWKDRLFPDTINDLIDECPYFEARPLIRIDEHGQPLQIGVSKSEALFQQFLSDRTHHTNFLYISGRKKKLRKTSATRKIPIAFQGHGVYRSGSHDITGPVSGNCLLTIGHFVFTRNFPKKIQSAVVHRGHAKRGAKYRAYNMLLRKLKTTDGSFLTEASVRFVNTSQFIEAGLMRWNFDSESL